MAKIVAPLMSQEVRGKMGGIVFNTYRGIATAKSFRSPTQPNTVGQVNARARLSDASRAWASLTVAQRAAWEVYAESHPEPDWTGKPKRLTGANMHARLNTRSALVGGVAVTDAPAIAAPGTPAGVTIVQSEAGNKPIELNFAQAPDAGHTWVVYMAGPLSAGRKPKRNMAAIVKQVISTDATGLDLVADPAAGRYGFWYQSIDETNGQASALIMVDLIAV